MSFSITGPSSVTVNVPADYPQVSAASFRQGSTMPGMEFVQGNSSRVLSTLVDPSVGLNQDIGAGDFTWWVQLSVPASLSGNAAIGSLGPNNTNALPSSDNAVALLQQNGDIQLVLGNTTNNTRYGLGLSGRTGQIVDITITRAGGSLAVYIDGTLITPTATNTGAGCPAGTTFNTTFAMIGGAHSSGNPNAFAGIVYRFVTYNRQLTATEVASLVRFGVDISDQWGSQAAILSPTVLNGGFETVGTTNTFANWSDGSVSGTTINRDTVVFDSGAASLRFDLDGSSSYRNVGQGILVAGRRYRVTAAFRHNHSSSIAPQIQLQNTVLPFSAVAPNTWQTQTAEAVSDGTVIIVVRRSGAPNSSQWYDSITVTRLGAIVDLDFTMGCGNQLQDASTNGFHVNLFGGFSWVNPRDFGQLRVSLSASGNTQFPVGLPAEAMITGIAANASGAVTLSIGTASGGTQVVNAASLSTGRNGPLTVASAFPGGTLWGNLSAAVATNITIDFSLTT